MVGASAECSALSELHSCPSEILQIYSHRTDLSTKIHPIFPSVTKCELSRTQLLIKAQKSCQFLYVPLLVPQAFLY